ncbi:hypothetical protein [Hyphococcus lacteus]|uniref:Uncharacterized protein n=1 Tax=Hyphococcus lacteus TaxID=3143536 RepID=A0ABV3Z6M8_9PROT
MMRIAHEEGIKLIVDQPCFATNKRHIFYMKQLSTIVEEIVFRHELQDGFIE